MRARAVVAAATGGWYWVDLWLRRRRMSVSEIAWCTPWLQPMQQRSEFEQLLELAKGSRAIVEIGSYLGGTSLLLANAAADDAIVVTIDNGISRTRVPVYRAFARRGQTVHPLIADSHDAVTVDRVRRLLRGREVDALFIDGDHTYEGARRDYELWSPLVRSGGIVAFHDITPGLTADGVPQLWRELGGGREFVAPDRDEGGFGIGVLTV